VALAVSLGSLVLVAAAAAGVLVLEPDVVTRARLAAGELVGSVAARSTTKTTKTTKTSGAAPATAPTDARGPVRAPATAPADARDAVTAPSPTALATTAASSQPPSTAPAPRAGVVEVPLASLPAQTVPPRSTFVTLPRHAAGHRVYVDGRVIDTTRSPLELRCGAHRVRIGSHGRARAVRLPCGGTYALR
jgi:hypothetical protein